MDAGYNTAGQTVVHTRFTDAIDPGTAADQQLPRADMVDNAMTIADGNGSGMPYDPVPGVEPTTPLDLMGDMVNADVTAGAVLDVNSDNVDYDRNVPSLESVRAQLTRLAPDDRSTLTLISPTRLIVSEIVPDERIQASASKTLKGRATLQPRLNGLADETAGHSITHRRVFERDGMHWVLREAKTIIDDTTHGMRVHGEQTVSLSNLHWFKNPVRNAERRVKRPNPTEVIPLSSPSTRVSKSVPGIRRMVSCDALSPDDPDYCGSGGGEEVVEEEAGEEEWTSAPILAAPMMSWDSSILMAR